MIQRVPLWINERNHANGIEPHDCITTESRRHAQATTAILGRPREEGAPDRGEHPAPSRPHWLLAIDDLSMVARGAGHEPALFCGGCSGAGRDREKVKDSHCPERDMYAKMSPVVERLRGFDTQRMEGQPRRPLAAATPVYRNRRRHNQSPADRVERSWIRYVTPEGAGCRYWICTTCFSRASVRLLPGAGPLPSKTATTWSSKLGSCGASGRVYRALP